MRHSGVRLPGGRHSVAWEAGSRSDGKDEGVAERTGRRRIDAERNRSRILDAAGALFRDDEAATMPAIAERAQLSVATAYRFFPSLSELRAEYLRLVIAELADYSARSTATGADLFADVLGEWLRLQSTYGDAIIHLRSHEGYLTRLRAGDPVITTVRRAWAQPITHLLHDLGQDSLDIEDALYLHNILFDPRELRDLRVQRGWSDATIAARVTRSYRALLRSWAQPTDDDAPEAAAASPG